MDSPQSSQAVERKRDAVAGEQRWTNRIRRIRWLVFLFFLVSTGVLVMLVMNLRDRNDIESWLGDDDAAVHEFQRFQDDFDLGDSVLVAFDGCRADDARLERAAANIEALPGVLRCVTPQRLAAAAGALGHSDLAQHMREVAPLVGSHASFCAMLVELKPDPNRDRAGMLATLGDQTREAGFEPASTHWGGAPVINVALDHWAERSLGTVAPIVALVGLACLIWSVRNPWIVASILFSGSLSVLATLALMAATGATMNLIAIALPPMIFVLSLSFSIHLIHHWNGAPHESSAVGHALLHTIRPTLLAALTTAIGSISLATSQFEPVRGFGLWGAVGTIIAFVVTSTWLPVTMIGARRHVPRPPRMLSHVLSRVPVEWAVGLWPVLVALAIPGLMRLKAETDGLRLLPDDCQTMEDYRVLERRLTGQLPVEIIIHHDPNSPWPRRCTITRHIGAWLRAHPYIESVSDGSGLFPHDDALAGSVMQQVAAQSPEAFRGHLTADGLQWRLTAYVASDQGAMLDRIVADVKDNVSRVSDVTVTGLVPLIVASQGEIFQSLAISLIAAAGVLFGVLWIAEGSMLAAGLIVLLNVTPVALVFGGLGWLGHPITMATLTTASIALGIALDDTMHLIENVRMERNAWPDRSIDDVVTATLERCVAPMIQTTLIAGAGMAVLAASPFVPIAEFGGIMATLLGLALLGDAVLLPAVLRTTLGTCLYR